MTIYSYHATHLLIGGLQRVGELLLLSITHSFIWLHQYELCVFELYDHSLFYWLVYPCCSLKLFHLDAVFGCQTVFDCHIPSAVVLFPTTDSSSDTAHFSCVALQLGIPLKVLAPFKCTVVLTPKIYMDYSHCFKVKECLLKHDRVFELLKSQ